MTIDVTLIRKPRSQATRSTVVPSPGTRGVPTLFIRTSRRPQVSIVFSTAARQESSSVTSVCIAMHWPPSARMKAAVLRLGRAGAR